MVLLLCSSINIQDEESIKYLSNEEFTSLLNRGESNINKILTILHGNFSTEELFDNKIIANYTVTLDNTNNTNNINQVLIKGTTLNDYEEEISEEFIIDVNAIFDCYCVDCKYLRSLHINLYGTGEYINIQIEG